MQLRQVHVRYERQVMPCSHNKRLLLKNEAGEWCMSCGSYRSDPCVVWRSPEINKWDLRQTPDDVPCTCGHLHSGHIKGWPDDTSCTECGPCEKFIPAR